MARKKILLICGNHNQASMQHQIAAHLTDYDVFYTPYYSDGFLKALTKAGLTDFSVLGGKPKAAAEKYFKEHDLPVDEEGLSHDYDLVITPNDLIVQKNIENKKIILLQEGMMDPENYRYHIVRNLGLPRYMANTSMTGLSDAYVKFCVMSEGWKEQFISKGVKEEKIAITGIPNFDNVDAFRDNDFPYKHYTLVATSHIRETLKYENRIQLIKDAVEIADGRMLIFKLHPAENEKRATREVERYAPGALIFHKGNTNHMLANCDVLITRYSSVVLVGAALGKEVYSDLDPEELEKLTPVQNQGTSAKNIADICKDFLD